MRFIIHKAEKIPTEKVILEAIQSGLTKYDGKTNIGDGSTLYDDHIMMHFDNPNFDIENDDSPCYINYKLRIEKVEL